MEMTAAEILKNVISSQTWKKKSVWEIIMLLRFPYLCIFSFRCVINQENII